MKRILLLTDNEELLNRFKNLLIKLDLVNHSAFSFSYAFSYMNSVFVEKYKNENWIKPVNVKNEIAYLVDNYDIIFSLHCKQLFPAALVTKVKCINVHPGYNPYNRGWFPQVFSIINSLKSGATIHEIDEQLDHGPIICQKEVTIEESDTSLTAYNKILDAEIELLNDHLVSILEGSYQTYLSEEGNLNLKKDFNVLCEINLDEVNTFRNHINKLRALTHGGYANAYFLDKDGNKVYVKLEFNKK